VRRNIALLVMALAVAMALVGCRPLFEDDAVSISVYTTFYPLYALTEAVIGDVPDIELHQLVQPQDGCLRSYQISDWDKYLLSAGADAVVMGGRGLESFESELFNWGEGGPAMAAVLYNLELYNQDEASAGESESHLRGANPHLYMSLKGAAQMVESISATLQTFDPRYAQRYVNNAQSAADRLDNLMAEMKDLLRPFAGSQVIIMNEALAYTARDYGFEIAEWIDRESGEALYDDALEDCLKRLEGSGARVALVEKQAPTAFVDAIEAAGFFVARLDILSTHSEGKGFDDYIQIQTGNARILFETFERAHAGRNDH